MQETQFLRNYAISGIGPSALRQAEQRKSEAARDVRHEIVSADAHYELSEDIFVEHFPANLKDKAPRVCFEQNWIVKRRELADRPLSGMSQKILAQHSGSGIYDLALRRAHRVAEGVAKEIVFPQSLLQYFGEPDRQLRELVFDIYNQHVAKLHANDAFFYPVAICTNWWDPEMAQETVRRIKSLGLKTLLLPWNPGEYPSGKSISWGDAEQEPFWSAIEEADLPVCFHITEKVNWEGRGRYGSWILQAMAPFRKPLGELIFGGVFDRNPAIKIVFAEGGISWVPPALQDCELIFDSFGSLLDPRPARRPSEYWFRNCYATFQTDQLGLEQLRYIGVDNAMWASDYPHTEGVFGYASISQQAVIAAASAADAAKILGGNARRVFDL